jgi:predicted anti-sigma-YlaC factor YlaD
MRCDDLPRALSEEGVDLEVLRNHLEKCPECRKKFKRDLEIEEALRDLSADMARADIVDEVRNCIGLLSGRRRRYGPIRRWVWGTVSVAILGLLVNALPVLGRWLGKAYDLFDEIDTGPALGLAMSPSQCAYLFCGMAAVVASLAVYLWREARRLTLCRPAGRVSRYRRLKGRR